MSTIAVNAITDANGGATTTINSVTPNVNNVVGKNLIINGAMQIAQRGTSTTGVTGSDYYTCDRYKTILTSLGTWTVEQSTDAPDGFSNSLKHSCTTADASPAAADILYLSQIIESQNLQQVAKGTASAKSLTCSFWVKSNKTGTYIVGLQEFQNTRYIANSYTINAANTWEKKTITFAGDTTGTLANDNSAGLYLQFYLGSGSDYSSGTLATSWESTVNVNRAVGQVNLADSTSNYINITGVQIEVGDTATEFEHRQYGTELQLCQRYYYRCSQRPLGYSQASAQLFRGSVDFPTTMRTAPSLDSSGNSFTVNSGAPAAGTVGLYTGSGSNPSPSAAYVYNSSNNWGAYSFVAVSAGFSSEL